MSLSLVILFLVFGCADVRTPQSDGHGYVVQLPWYSQSKGYILQKVPIKSLKNIDDVSGSTAQFYVYPYLKNNKLTGPVPTARFITTRDGVIIPKDIITTQLYTVYAHLERLREFDKMMGIDSLIKWPVKVGIAVNYRDESGALVNNNAAYSATLDAYLFMPYTDSKVPITLNGAVLAHEHFHSLFAQLVNYNNVETPSSVHADSVEKAFELYSEKKMETQNLAASEKANLMLYKIMNEGLADFWGWIYTQNNNFVSQSLSQDKGSRKIEAQNINLFTKDYLAQNYDLISDREIYQLGNIYARIFTNFAIDYAKHREIEISVAQVEIAKSLVATLKDYNMKATQLNAEKQVIDPGLFMNLFMNHIKDLSIQDCNYFESVFADKKDILTNAKCVELQTGNRHALAVD